MKQFAELLDKLYFTYSLLDKVALLEDFFRQTSDPERGYALAVLANTLSFPTFKRPMIKELMQEQVPAYLFELSYDYVGDLSDTVALLWPDGALEEPLPGLVEIIDQFNTIPDTQYKDYLRELLNKASRNERWALLKLGTGNLRIGVSARFIKRALASYGQQPLQEIEKIWHATEPPYEELFAWLEGRGLAPDITSKLFFHPVMLSHPLNDDDLTKLDPSEFAVEKKFDGIRIQAICTKDKKGLFTRTGEDISHAFPDLLTTFTGNVVLDGELVIQNAEGICSFNELQQRLNRKKISAKLMEQYPAAMILYDILSWNGEDLRHLPFYERRKKLEDWFAVNPAANLLISPLITLKPGQSLTTLKEKVLAEQHPAVEGLMLKHHQSPYLAGRPRGHWFKWKRDPKLVDAILMYAQRGHGKRSSYYSDYTFGLWQDGALLPIGKAYSGFTDEELYRLDQWIRQHTIQRFGPVREVEKALIFEVAFDAVNYSTRHKSGVALRFPRINRIRWDKPITEADSLQNLVDMIQHN